MTDYSMVIDLDLCIGCNACTLACKVENGTPRGVFFCKVLEYERGRLPDVVRIFLPVMCNHCVDAPCVMVCPTKASSIDENGVVQIDPEKCIGCRSCIVACPYHARSYTSEDNYYFDDTPIPYPVKPGPGTTGIVQKCDFCTDRRNRGEDPACVAACPTSCRTFGDMDDPGSDINVIRGSEYYFQLLPVTGIKPKVGYLSKHKARLLGQE